MAVDVSCCLLLWWSMAVIVRCVLFGGLLFAVCWLCVCMYIVVCCDVLLIGCYFFGVWLLLCGCRLLVVGLMCVVACCWVYAVVGE